MKRNPDIKPQYFTRFMCKTLALLCIIPTLALPLAAQSYGIIGSVLTTDIKAYINGYEIPAYNVDGNMVIVGSDLRNYGFNVVYDNNTRTSSVSMNPYGTWSPLDTSSYYNGSIGTKVMDVYDTDISVLLNGIPVTSYNVNGNMAFKFSELKMFGSYYYDNASRTTNLWLEGNSYSQPYEDYSYNYNDNWNTSANNSDMYGSSVPDNGSYSLGETWIVDGQWEFSITEVEIHNLCSDYANNANGYTNEQVVMIHYSYKNIGYTEHELNFSGYDFSVSDERSEIAEHYYHCNHAKSKYCPVGTKCSDAMATFVLLNNSSEIRIDVEKYAFDGTGNHRATFIIPIGTHYSGDNSEIRNELKSSNSHSISQLTSFLSFYNLGVKSHSGIFTSMSGYIKYSDNSFIQYMYTNLQAAYNNFNDALAISEQYSAMDDITDELEKVIESLDSVSTGNYSVTQIASILEPNADRFDDILAEVKRIANN